MDGTSGIRNFYKTKPLLSLHYASTNKNKQTLTTPRNTYNTSAYTSWSAIFSAPRVYKNFFSM